MRILLGEGKFELCLTRFFLNNYYHSQENKSNDNIFTDGKVCTDTIDSSSILSKNNSPFGIGDGGTVKLHSNYSHFDYFRAPPYLFQKEGGF